MNRIEPRDWYKDVFAEVQLDSDVLRLPIITYQSLPEIEKDQVRQTQIFQEEVIQVLGTQEDFNLIMKFNKTIGWIDSQKIKFIKDLSSFRTPGQGLISPDQFFKNWKGIGYLFGGISKNGIDCSGFTQKFFLDVFGKVIPKYSQDQRKIGQPQKSQEMQNFNLVYCHRKLSDMYHVAIFFEKELWHARPKYGVVSQSIEEFTDLFEIDCVASIL